MTPNKRDLKAYARFDGTGRIVAGSLVLRRTKPKNGNWKEIEGYECCNPIITTTTTTAVPQALRLTFSTIEAANVLVGDATDVTDWNTLFNLPALGTPFSSVEVIGTEIFLYGGANIKVKPGMLALYNNDFLIKVIDDAGCITSVGGDAFYYAYELTDVYLPECTIVYGWQDSPYQWQGGFAGCQKLVNLYIPKLEYAGDAAFKDCNTLASINFPVLRTAGDSCWGNCYLLTTANLPVVNYLGINAFIFTQISTYSFPYLVVLERLNAGFGNPITTVNLPSVRFVNSGALSPGNNLTTINLPVVEAIGNTLGDDYVFFGIAGNTISLTIASAMMTVNSGSPDGDIVYLQTNNTVTVIPV